MWCGERLNGTCMPDIYDFLNCVVDFMFSWSKTAQANTSWWLYLQNVPGRIPWLQSGQTGWRCTKKLRSKAGTVFKDLIILGLNPGGGNRCISSQLLRTGLGFTYAPIQWVPRALSLGVNQPGHEADYSVLSSAKVKMNGTILPVPLYAFMMIGTALLFLNTEAVSPHF
jgi:hypothetical protein